MYREMSDGVDQKKNKRLKEDERWHVSNGVNGSW